MGQRGGLRLRGGAGLDRDDRLARGQRAAGRLHERFGPADAFDEQHDLARVRVVDDEIEVVGKPEVGLVARCDAIGEAQTPISAGAHEELDQPAGLEQAGDRPGLQPAEVSVGIAEQALAERISAHAIRPGDAQAALGHEILEPGAAHLRLWVLAVAEHRGIDGGGLDAPRFRIDENIGHCRARHDHQGVVDRFGKVAQRGIAALAEYLRLPRIDQRDAPTIAELAQVLVDLAGPARALGGAHDGKRLRLQCAHGRMEERAV